MLFRSALHYNEQEERYYTLNHIPSYEDMINDKELSNQYQEQWDLERIPLKELLENDKLEDIDEFGMIGEDTPQAYKPFILNLGQCFLDCSKILNHSSMTPCLTFRLSLQAPCWGAHQPTPCV